MYFIGTSRCYMLIVHRIKYAFHAVVFPFYGRDKMLLPHGSKSKIAIFLLNYQYLLTIKILIHLRLEIIKEGRLTFCDKNLKSIKFNPVESRKLYLTYTNYQQYVKIIKVIYSVFINYISHLLFLFICITNSQTKSSITASICFM